MPIDQNDLTDDGASSGDTRLALRKSAEAALRESAEAALRDFKLNDQQRAAVEHTGGPLIVLAGPGTGKTRVLTARILRLLRDGAEPSSILALTFTVKAAGEMRSRLAEMLGDAAHQVRLITFHALAWRLIGRFSDVLKLPAELRLRDSAETNRILRAIARRERLFAYRASEDHRMIVKQAARFIADCRSAHRSPAEALAAAQAWTDSLRDADHTDPEFQGQAVAAQQFADATQLYALFEKETRQQGLIGYDDALTLACELLGHEAFAGPLIRSEIKHLLVDEFQDVNAAQIEMLRRLAPPRSGVGGSAPDVMVVGDDDQAIYAFRGASTNAFARFMDIYEPARAAAGSAVVTQQRLEINYRSRPMVVRAGQAIIGRSKTRFDPDKTLLPNPLIPEADANADASVEGWTIPGKVDQFGPVVIGLIERDRAASGRAYEQYAVITRNHTMADRIAQSLRLAGIAVDRRHKRTLDDSLGVGCVLNWVQLLIEPGNTNAAQRLLLLPPYSVPHELVAGWVTAYQREQYAMESDDVPQPETTAGAAATTGFLAWLGQRYGNDLPASARSLLESAERLAVPARTLTADRVIESLIHESGVVYSAHNQTDRLELVMDLAAFIRFVRARLPHLEPPADLRAFWAYYNDLPENERTIELDGADDEPERTVSLDYDADNAPEPAGGVTVVTAHASKGLEFDTVFLVDVRPGDGFPSVRNRSDEPLPTPAGFLNSQDEAKADEERRIFYVACTRAERRLVLIAKRRKTKATTSTDFFLELTDQTRGLSVVEQNAESVLDSLELGMNPLADPPLLPDADPMLERIRQRARHERLSAFAALHAAEDAGADADRLAELTMQLSDHARSLAAIRLIERGEHERAADLIAQVDLARQEGLMRLLRRELESRESPFKPMRPPLRLSYSSVSAYYRCPRCFWIARELKIDSGLSPELILGSAVHETLEAHFKAVQRTDAAMDAAMVGADQTTQRLTVEHATRSVRQRLLTRLPAHQPPDPELLDRAQAMVQRAIVELHDGGSEILEIERKFEIPYQTQDNKAITHTITGKFDRLDRMIDGSLRIVDYKTGQPWKSLIDVKSDDAQLGVYALALQHLFGDAPATGEYWLLSTGQRGTLNLAEIRWDRLYQWLDKAINGMLRGEFPRSADCQGICQLLDLDTDLQ